MARRRYNPLVDILRSPWWLPAVIGGFLFLFSKYIKEIKTGLLPIGLIFSPLIKLGGIVLLCIAAFLLLKTIIQSLFLTILRKQANFPQKAARISLVWDIVRYIFEICKQKWPASQAGSVRADAWRGERPHGAAESFTNQSGTATLIGESGAWVDIAEKMQQQGLNIRKIEDTEPLLAQLRQKYQPWLDSFHEGIAKCVHFKNNQIAVLRAEPGFFTAIINWFLILWREREIARLHEEEKQYAKSLSGNIQTLESWLQSPELAGAKAELEAIDQLRKLPGEYTVFSNIRLRAARAIRFNDGWLKSAQLDHLVLSPAGVFVIETKRWSKKFAETGEYHDPYAQVQRAGYLCYALLRRAFGKTPVRNIIVSDGSLPPAPADSHVKVRHLAELNGYLTWFNQRELLPDRLQDIRLYLEQYVNPFHPAADLTNGDPAEILNSGFPGKILREAGPEGLRPAAAQEMRHKSRAVLIPTEPPPIKVNEEFKYMPPAMRKELEDKEKTKRQELILGKSGGQGAPETKKPHEPLPPNTPKDFKYMPPSMRAELEKE